MRTRAGSTAILKTADPLAGVIGLCADDAMIAQQRAAAAGLAPELIWYDVPTATTLSEELCPTARATPPPQALARSLQRVHRLAVDGISVRRLQDVVTRYARLGGCEVDTEAAARVDATDSQPVLIHADPHPGNWAGPAHRPMLIDWEYAAGGNAVFDLAAVCIEFRFDPRGCAAFLGEYGYDDSREVFDVACAVYRQIVQLWTQARRAATSS